MFSGLDSVISAATSSHTKADLPFISEILKEEYGYITMIAGTSKILSFGIWWKLSYFVCTNFLREMACWLQKLVCTTSFS